MIDVFTDERSVDEMFSATNFELCVSSIIRQTSLHLCDFKKSSIPLAPRSVAPKRFLTPRSEWITGSISLNACVDFE